MKATFPDPTEAVPQPEADSILIGRDFYALSGNLPAGTSLMWGLNLKSFNKSETAAQAQLLAEAFQGARSNLTKHVKLVDIEIGNEPDFYGPNTRVPGPLDSSWDLTNYSTTWQEYAEVVRGAVRLDDSETSPKLSPGAFTGYVAPGWSVDGAIMAGILEKPGLRSVTGQFGTHLYSGAFSPGLEFAPGELMNKKFIRGNLTTKASEVKAAKAFGVDYSLTESNSFAMSVSGTPSEPRAIVGILRFFDQPANWYITVMESQASAIPSKASYGGLITCYMQPQWALNEYTCITESALLTMHSSLSLF
ncbi:hypothetical protein FJTKL_04724 [Diaporthe vaccinii]|uniref:Beta-glucuronidase C-terminal domain-containing protein n=1 Tax=Diaporthe vaccinii TaxID=105482 RepID=A0ABR4EZX6_9PEZI